MVEKVPRINVPTNIHDPIDAYYNKYSVLEGGKVLLDNTYDFFALNNNIQAKFVSILTNEVDIIDPRKFIRNKHGMDYSFQFDFEMIDEGIVTYNEVDYLRSYLAGKKSQIPIIDLMEKQVELVQNPFVFMLYGEDKNGDRMPISKVLNTLSDKKAELYNKERLNEEEEKALSCINTVFELSGSVMENYRSRFLLYEGALQELAKEEYGEQMESKENIGESQKAELVTPSVRVSDKMYLMENLPMLAPFAKDENIENLGKYSNGAVISECVTPYQEIITDEKEIESLYNWHANLIEFNEELKLNEITKEVIEKSVILKDIEENVKIEPIRGKKYYK